MNIAYSSMKSYSILLIIILQCKYNLLMHIYHSKKINRISCKTKKKINTKVHDTCLINSIYNINISKIHMSIKVFQLFTYVFLVFHVYSKDVNAQNVTVFPADSFVESIGVNTHWEFASVYVYNYTGLKEKLAQLGVRYLRGQTFQAVYNRSNDLYNSLGIRTNILMGRRKDGPWPQPLDLDQIDFELNEIKTEALIPTVTLEGPNEYDVSHGADLEWIQTINNYNILLYTKVRADEQLKHLPIIGPSLTTLKAYESVGNADPYIDYANIHLYQWTFWPGFNGLDQNGSTSIPWYLNYLARQQSPEGKLVQVTETGYTNYIDYGGLSEEADGKYMPRIFAEFFRQGIYRTYKYELINNGIEGREGLFGLLRNNLTEKPSFKAMQTIITLLNDKGPSFQPEQFNYTLNGSLHDVRQLLFQKRNGDFYLMIWLEISCWDVNHKIDLYPSPQLLTLTLQDTNNISNAILYTFNNTADLNIVNMTVNNNQILFNVTEKISIVKFSNVNPHLIPNGVYRIAPKHALHLSLENSNKHSQYATVCDSNYMSNFNQQWTFESLGNFFYNVTNQGTFGQHWKIDSLPNGYYRIQINNEKNQCLSVNMNRTTQILSCSHDSDDQQWKIEWITQN